MPLDLQNTRYVDPGAVALDGTGADMTHEILALPANLDPSECAVRSCSAYRYVQYGLQVLARKCYK